MSAAAHVLNQMLRDKRLAYLLGPGSESYELLTAEQAKAEGIDVEAFRTKFDARLKTERVYTAGVLENREPPAREQDELAQQPERSIA